MSDEASHDEIELLVEAKHFLSLFGILEEKVARCKIADRVRDLIVETSTIPRKPKAREGENRKKASKGS